MDPVVRKVHCLQSLVELESLKEKKKEVNRIVNLYFQFPEPSPEDPLGNRELWSRSPDGNVTKCVDKALKHCHKIQNLYQVNEI